MRQLAGRAGTGLLKTAPHLVEPIRFLLPIYQWQRSSGIHDSMRALPSTTSSRSGDGLPPSGRLGAGRDRGIAETSARGGARIRCCTTMTAKPTMRASCSPCCSMRAPAAPTSRTGAPRRRLRRLKTATPWSSTSAGYGQPRRCPLHRQCGRALVAGDRRHEQRGAGPSRPLRLVRGSHIVLEDAGPSRSRRLYVAGPKRPRRLRAALARQALSHRRHDRNPRSKAIRPRRSAPGKEQAYLLEAYNRYFGSAGGPATEADVVWTWSGVRALARRRGGKRPSRVTRRSCAGHGRQRHRRLR